MDNPYTKMIGMMRDEGKAFNPPSILLAEVVSISPLMIKIGDLQIDEDNILISDYLLEDYSREFSGGGIKPQVGGATGGAIPIGLSAPPPPHTHELVSLGLDKVVFTMGWGLGVGDLVAVFSTYDRQKYIIMSRVVSA